LTDKDFNQIMDTLANQPGGKFQNNRFNTAPQMTWGIYLPQVGLHNASLSTTASWHSVQGRRTVRAISCSNGCGVSVDKCIWH